MEVVDKVPEQVKENIHEQALEKLARREKRAYRVGMHTANMKIMGEVRKTIIPSMDLYISDVTNKGVISSHIEYRISYNNTTMPFGHVYGQSGCLCLGNIPVPPFVDPHNLMDPLETLFLYNDRNINHGGAKLPITPKQDDAVRQLATCYNIEVNTQDCHYIENDTVWDLCAQLLEKYNIFDAFSIADKLFTIVFEREKQ